MAININDRGLPQISEMQVISISGRVYLPSVFILICPKAETLRLNKINADTEKRRDRAKIDWEDRQQQIDEQLQRLDKYQVLTILSHFELMSQKLTFNTETDAR